MSVFNYAVSQGVSVIGTAITGDTETYNAQYQAAMQKYSIASAKSASEHNISAIAQDKVTSNTQIRLQQDQAEAAAILSAATAGVEGGSVDATIYGTKRSEAQAIGSVAEQAEQSTNAELANVASQQSALLSVQDADTSTSSYLMDGITGWINNFEMSDLEIGAMLSGGGGEGSASETFSTNWSASNLDTNSRSA